ncbi:hypothetical protein [Raoultella planticola]
MPCGRHFAAWPGLVPRQHSSSNKHLRTHLFYTDEAHSSYNSLDT